MDQLDEFKSIPAMESRLVSQHRLVVANPPGMSTTPKPRMISRPFSEARPLEATTFPQSWIRDHSLGISAVFLGGLILFATFKKGMSRGKAEASRRYDEKLSRLKTDLQRSMEQLARSHRDLQAELKDSKLTPNGHALVSYIDEGVSHHLRHDGYVMRVERKLEHRTVAEAVLGRELAPNEIVHHIYGKAKDDNSIGNLCILDREQHDLFHTFLSREVKLKGRYPRIAEQKTWLKRHFHGILLEEALENKKVAYPPIVPGGGLPAEQADPPVQVFAPEAAD